MILGKSLMDKVYSKNNNNNTTLKSSEDGISLWIRELKEEKDTLRKEL